MVIVYFGSRTKETNMEKNVQKCGVVNGVINGRAKRMKIKFENVAGMTCGIINNNFEIELADGQIVPKECYCKFIKYVSRPYDNGKQRPFKMIRKEKENVR